MSHRVLFYGNVSEYKGIRLLLRAFEYAAKARNEKLDLFIAGRSRTNTESLRSLIDSSLAAASITWIDRFISHQETEALFRTADC